MTAIHSAVIFDVDGPLLDFFARYYADKEAEFTREGETFGDERVRISISASSWRPSSVGA